MLAQPCHSLGVHSGALSSIPDLSIALGAALGSEWGPAFVVFLAGVCAGAINAVAGGGTLVSFPALLWLGRDPIVANATNALALWPGSLAGSWAYRAQLIGVRPVLRFLAPAAMLGAVAGGALLLATPQKLFGALVPYMILVATLLLAIQRPLAKRLAAGQAPEGAELDRPTLGLVLGQFLVAIYGGYFGAGQGIVLLAMYGVCGIASIHRRNAIKNVVATLTNGAAGAYFVVTGRVNWLDAAVLAMGAIVGATLAARTLRNWPKERAEIAVVVVGLVNALALFLRQ